MAERIPLPEGIPLIDRINEFCAGWCPTCRKAVRILFKTEISEKKKMTPKSSKQKGRRAQQAAADIIVKTFGLSEVDVKSVGMGQHGQDLELSEKAREVWPFHAIEITASLNVGLLSKFEQAKQHAKKQAKGEVYGNGRPLLLFKRNSTPLFAVTLFEDLAEAIKETSRKEGEN
ncbi:MAG: hypothetical protein JXB23_16825 [Candidatus Aminicenantes bacterium]|nr:hypothetical protein [Candidatus Aminicenantes bacterium]